MDGYIIFGGPSCVGWSVHPSSPEQEDNDDRRQSEPDEDEENLRS